MIKAVVFDLDGVLLDTERLNFIFKREMIKKEGYNVTEDDLIKSFGLGKKEVAEYYYKITGDREVYNRLRTYRRMKTLEYIEENGLPYRKGALEILKYLKDHNILIALATSTGKDLLDKYMLYSDMFTYFDVIVTGDIIERGKPSPDIYLKAIKDLNVDADSALAVEDSFNGILAAYRAKLKTVYCKDMLEFNKEQLEYVDYPISDLTDIKQIIKDDIMSKEEK